MIILKNRRTSKRGGTRQQSYVTSLVRVKEGERMGRPRKFNSVKALDEAWEEYKKDCDNQMVLTHDFSSKNSEFVSKELKRSVTYTIEGFCAFVGISRAAFYERYADNEKFADIVTRMREEAEIDARKKFELQIIPSQLAGLWMSKYGYTTKVENNVSGLQDEMSKLDDLLKQVGG